MSAEVTAAKPQRIVSLDIFRGLNIALMIFVNELAETKGQPWWTYHAPGRVDVMTYVDMVFPGFLLILGMSLPLALNARVRRGDGSLQLVWYVVLRAVALIVLGLILANGARGDAALMHGLSPFAWGLLALAGAFLVWMDYPRIDPKNRKSLHLILRCVGVVLIAALAVIYRRVDKSGSVAWLSFGYPEILGLIGYTYFVSGLCYLLTRRWLWAPAIWFVVFAVFNITSAAHITDVHLPWWYWPVGNGSMPALTFAGVVLSTIFFLDTRLDTFRKKAGPAVAFGIAAAVAARLLYPLGISKIRATPTWVLYTVAACCIVYTLLYWVCDVRKLSGWARPVSSAGSNTLLTYLLPDLWFYVTGLVGFTWCSSHFAYGLGGVAKAVVFTVMMLALSEVLTRLRVRLQL